LLSPGGNYFAAIILQRCQIFFSGAIISSTRSYFFFFLCIFSLTVFAEADLREQ